MPVCGVRQGAVCAARWRFGAACVLLRVTLAKSGGRHLVGEGEGCVLKIAFIDRVGSRPRLKLAWVLLALCGALLASWRLWAEWVPARPMAVAVFEVGRGVRAGGVEPRLYAPNNRVPRRVMAGRDAAGRASILPSERQHVTIFATPGDSYDIMPVDPARGLPVVVVGEIGGPPLGATDGMPVELPIPFGVGASDNSLVPFDTTEPWSSVSDRLAAIARSCAPVDGLVRARLTTEQWLFEIGTCRYTTPVSAGRPQALVVLGGPRTARIALTDPADPIATLGLRILWPAAVVAIAIGLGTWLLPALGVVALVIASASLVKPFVAMLLCLFCVLAGLAVLLVAPVTGVRGRSVAALVAGLLIPVTSPWHGAIIAGVPTGERVLLDASGACVVLGYSSIRGAGLARPDAQTFASELAAMCPKTCPTVTRVAGDGRTLKWLRARLDSAPPTHTQPRGYFFGGVNDDLDLVVSHQLQPMRLFSHALMAISLWEWPGQKMLPLDPHDLDAALLGLPPSQIAQQEDDLAALAAHFTGRDGQYFHIADALVTDIEPEGPGEARQKIAARRVRELPPNRVWSLAGHFHQRIAATWFNDQVHPSEFGARRILIDLKPMLCPADP
jgi:hypothetical protein